MTGYIIITVVMSIVGFVVSNRLKYKFNKYNKVGLSSGKSGAQVAADMLAHYGINDVNIVEGTGTLTDHYNPMTKTVSLSPGVFQGRSVAAAAVAAHECGHAVQHATAYTWLTMRSKMVPVVSFASKAQQFLLLAALGALGIQAGGTLLLVTIGVFAATTLFSLVTLPVEFDASNRALAWLDATGTVQGAEYDGAKDALTWAAMTYVAAALASLVTLLYLVMRFAGE